MFIRSMEIFFRQAESQCLVQKVGSPIGESGQRAEHHNDRILIQLVHFPDEASLHIKSDDLLFVRFQRVPFQCFLIGCPLYVQIRNLCLECAITLLIPQHLLIMLRDKFGS
jgi:hypothetical protein